MEKTPELVSPAWATVLVSAGITVLLFFSSGQAPALADSWRLPEPKDYFSESERFVFHVTPRAVRSPLSYFRDKTIGREQPGQDSGGPAACRGWLGERHADGSYRKIWDGVLVNDVAPVSAIIADDGRHVATFDNWHFMGIGEDVITIYGPDGRLIRKLGLANLMDPLEIEELPRTVSSIWWGGKHWIDAEDDTLVLEVAVDSRDPFGEHRKYRSIRIRLEDGQVLTEPVIYQVLRDGVAVLTVVDGRPKGTVTAGARASGQPYLQSGFLSAVILVANETKRLKAYFAQSRSTREFLGKLRGARYEVRRE